MKVTYNGASKDGVEVYDRATDATVSFAYGEPVEVSDELGRALLDQSPDEWTKQPKAKSAAVNEEG